MTVMNLKIQELRSKVNRLKGQGKGHYNSYKLLKQKVMVLLLLMLMRLSNVIAQTVPSIEDGATALDEAATSIGTYFDPIANLIYAMGALIALIGAIRVYMKWQSGDPDVIKAAAGWFGASIFLLMIVTLVKSFFGLE